MIKSNIYTLTIIIAILSANAHATIPMGIPYYIILENVINTQKQSHSQCLYKAINETEKKACHSIIENIKAIEKKNQHAIMRKSEEK